VCECVFLIAIIKKKRKKIRAKKNETDMCRPYKSGF
jgi:hypothetical protein